ncbi:MAG: hypothetical protein M3Q07_23860 [Pseudobdellovibrionaceae bacterium]|nr:hypothetical protein [Pseudobdellovibrionaceae bacterium]
MLFEEAALIYEADGTVTIEAPWMRTTISNWPGRPFPAELYAFPSIQKLPYWYHSPRPREALPISSQDAYLDGIEILFETAESLIGESCDWELDALLKKSLIQTMDMDEAVGFDPFAAYAVLQRFVLVNGLKLNRLGRMVKDKFAQDGPVSFTCLSRTSGRTRTLLVFRHTRMSSCTRSFPELCRTCRATDGTVCCR